MLVGRLLGGVFAMSSPPIMILPAVIDSSPEIMRSSVVLPHPEGPRSAKNSFWAMSKETSSTAMTLPANFLLTLRMETIGSDMGSTFGRFGRSLQFHGENGGNHRDENEHARGRVDVGCHAPPYQRIDLDREG